jgi:16S rRNA G966 N2-methylase RsmD
MDWETLPQTCYLDKKRYVPFKPEKDIALAKFNRDLWKKKFPQDIVKNVQIEKLMLTNIGIYSIGTPQISKSLVELISMLCSKFGLNCNELTITETNGGVGGFSIRLAHAFKNLNIVEINEEHVKVIKNNLKTYNIDGKIVIYNTDYLSVLYELKNDIIVCDPPWGGYDYNKKKHTNLGFNNVNVICIINELLKRNLFKIFILMAPKNYNVSDFILGIKSPNIFIHKLEKHYFIAVINT